MKNSAMKQRLQHVKTDIAIYLCYNNVMFQKFYNKLNHQEYLTATSTSGKCTAGRAVRLMLFIAQVFVEYFTEYLTSPLIPEITSNYRVL